jgi:hypothetical protein
MYWVLRKKINRGHVEGNLVSFLDNLSMHHQSSNRFIQEEKVERKGAGNRRTFKTSVLKTYEASYK